MSVAAAVKAEAVLRGAFGLHGTRAGLLWTDLHPAFVDTLCLTKQLHVAQAASGARFAVPSGSADFPHRAPGDAKLHRQNRGCALLAGRATGRTPGRAEFPLAATALALLKPGLCLVLVPHFYPQCFGRGSHLDLLPLAVLFLTGVSPSLPISLAAASRKSRGRKKDHMLLS